MTDPKDLKLLLLKVLAVTNEFWPLGRFFGRMEVKKVLQNFKTMENRLNDHFYRRRGEFSSLVRSNERNFFPVVLTCETFGR